jgi:hypothetical protein
MWRRRCPSLLKERGGPGETDRRIRAKSIGRAHALGGGREDRSERTSTNSTDPAGFSLTEPIAKRYKADENGHRQHGHDRREGLGGPPGRVL